MIWIKLHHLKNIIPSPKNGSTSVPNGVGDYLKTHPMSQV